MRGQGIEGDVRVFAFSALEDREVLADAQLASLRLRLQESFGKEGSERWRFELHGVLDAAQPRQVSLPSRVARTSSSQLLDLESALLEDDLGSVALVGRIDRLNLRYEGDAFRLTIGRQPITWGVNTFWPVLDLFSPFVPQSIDRDWKAGIDSIRAVVPLGDLSELEIVAAAQGQRLPEDGSFGALARLHKGKVDFGFMAGHFHTDTVLGGFVTTDVKGTGLRAEVAYTDARRSLVSATEPEEFVRATLGVDRLFGAYTFLSFELSWNGYGVDEPEDYLARAVLDRLSSGEITTLAKRYAGVSLARQVGPLWSVSSALLINADDGSVLLQPAVSRSLSDNSSFQAGAFIGFGDGLSADGGVLSEYGAIRTTAWASLKTYF